MDFCNFQQSLEQPQQQKVVVEKLYTAVLDILKDEKSPEAKMNIIKELFYIAKSINKEEIRFLKTQQIVSNSLYHFPRLC